MYDDRYEDFGATQVTGVGPTDRLQGFGTVLSVSALGAAPGYFGIRMGMQPTHSTTEYNVASIQESVWI